MPILPPTRRHSLSDTRKGGDLIHKRPKTSKTSATASSNYSKTQRNIIKMAQNCCTMLYERLTVNALAEYRIEQQTDRYIALYQGLLG